MHRSPFECEKLGIDDQRQPSPQQLTLVCAELEALHGVGAFHEGETGIERYVLGELVGQVELQLVTQRHTKLFELRGSSHIVVGDACVQRPERVAVDAEIGVLEARREGVKIGADIEEVHCAVEFHV